MAGRLSFQDAEKIRRARAQGLSNMDLAKIYGVSNQTIWNIVTNKSHLVDKPLLTEEERKRNKQDWRMKNQFGITVDEWDEMLKKANYACEACGSKLEDQPPHPATGKPYLSCDHDHQTGMARGVLCRACNWALGHAYDSSETLFRLAEYLKARGK